MKEFLALHNRTATRTEVQNVINLAKEQNNTSVIYRLSKILNDHPDSNRFVINIQQYPQAPTSLAGARHSGNYREALDDCGRLRKGWKFEKGNVVKVTPKAPKAATTKSPVQPAPSTSQTRPTRPTRPTAPKTPEHFATDLNLDTLTRSYQWISFDPEARAQRDQKQWSELFTSLYNSLIDEANKQGVAQDYNNAFEKGYASLLKLEKEIIAIRSKTFSTGVTGGGNITQKKIDNNERLLRREMEKQQLWKEKYDKLHNILAKIAKNKPADQYDNGDVIKSTDTHAIKKIQDKIKTLEEEIDFIKRSNKAVKEYKANNDYTVFAKYNITNEQANEILNEIQNYGFALRSSLQNRNAEIRRLKARIETLQKNQLQGEKEILIEGGKIVSNGEAQRLQIFFDGIPSKEIREALKAHAFKWAPTAKAWQRTLTANAIDVINRLISNGTLKKRSALNAPTDEIAFLAAAGIDNFQEAPDDEPAGLGKPVPAANIYQMVTDKIISMLQNARPSDYKRTWKDDTFFIPLNFDSKKPYRGVNRLLLQERIGLIGNYANPYFLTFNQIKKHGGKLRKGAKGYEVIYYTIRYVVPDDKDSGRRAYSSTIVQKVKNFLDKHHLSEEIVTRIPMIRYYHVYNGTDIEGIPFKLQEVQIGRAVPDDAPENQAAQLIVENYPNPPAIKHGGDRAYYQPNTDKVQIPKFSQFNAANDYYRTLFHELTHSTGHESRLNRDFSGSFGDEAYAKEELVAEFGAVFLSAWAGIMWYNNQNHAAYLKSWQQAIQTAQADSRYLMRAASLAQAATDHILAIDNDGQPAFIHQLKGPTSPTRPTRPTRPKNTTTPKAPNFESVKTIPLKDLYTDEKRFQNRKKLNEEIVNNIVKNFKPTDLDPLVVWYDKKQDKTFVLAGHHRYEALRRLGHKTVPVKFANTDYPSEADAIRYAKEISNANRTLEEPYERASIYRQYRDNGYSEKEINEKAAIEGKNRSYILNLSCLNPKGSTMSTLVQFSQTQSKSDKNEIERIADWIGQARRNAPDLTNAHETEMFDFLMNREASKRANTKAKFLEYVRACYNPFEPTAPLNLTRVKYQSEGERQYDEEVNNLKNQISTYQGYIDDLKNRFINPLNPQYINPNSPDYMQVKQIADSKIAEYNTKIQYYQKELLKVYQNKQTYIKPTGQIALFGKHPEINTLAFKRMKVTELREFTLEFYRLFLKGKKKEIEKHLKEVVFTSDGGRKIAYGEAMYSAKAAVIEHLDTLIKNSTYNNWGDRKPSDSEEILGYLNFKSKITIDGKKRHVRIAISVDKDRKFKFKSYDVGIKKSNRAPKGTLPSNGGTRLPDSASTHKGVKPFNDGVETLSTKNTAKTVPNSSLAAPTIFVDHTPDTSDTSPATQNPHTLAAKMQALQHRTFESFVIASPQMQAFLGDVERKHTGSTAITLTGGAGSGKTRFAFQFIGALAQNYKVGHASLEEHPDSKLYYDKVQQYLDTTAQANVEAPDIENMQDLRNLILRNDVIVIDSFTKIREWDRNFLLDRDLRKAYNGKLFLIIFQQTVAGNMRGGTTSEFDGDIILYTHVAPDYRDNYVYPTKNRYNAQPATALRYSTYYQQMLPPDDPAVGANGNSPLNSNSPTSPTGPTSPTTNTYEVIY